MDSTPKDGRSSIFLWRGILADKSRRQRYLAFFVLTVIATALTFTQNGLMLTEMLTDGDAYVVLLLVPMALAAMALGTLPGVLLGIVCGGVLALHSHVQPLGYFEAVTISPYPTLILFGATGLMLGLLFAFALRTKPLGWRRIVRIALVCIFVSLFFSVAFFVLSSAQISLRFLISVDGDVDRLNQEYVAQAAMHLGNPILQAGVDVIAMLVACLIVDRIVERWIPYNERHLQKTFRLWLLLVVSLGFMLVSTVSFVVVTEQELAANEANMRGNLTYISDQLKANVRRGDMLGGMASRLSDKLTDAEVKEFENAYSDQTILEGFAEQSYGTVVVCTGSSSEDVIVASNSSRFEIGHMLGDALDTDTLSTMAYALRTNTLQRMVFDSIDAENSSRIAVAEVNYLMAKDDGDYTIMIMRPSSMVFAERGGTTMWIVLATFVLLSLVFVSVTLLLLYVVQRPLAHANERLAAICDGKLDTTVDSSGSVEMCDLSAGINDTVGALKGFIADAERRTSQDLQTARTIQKSALPSTFPPFPDIKAFDIYASMNAAKEVGGDFYDLFLIDDHTLGFLIADVSGKGIPGALFMMAAKAEIDNYMQTGMDLAEAIQTANYRLCEGNDAGMFVTVWAAELDYQTGKLTYVNAGHNPPLLRHDGTWEWLDKRSGLFMGTFEKAKYKSFELLLEPDDELLLYTDGVNEAFNVDEEEYGNDRLEEFVREHANLAPKALVRELRKSVAQWAEGAEQSDDITILALEYGSAPQASDSISVPATIEHLDEVLDFVDNELAQRLCPIKVQRRTDIALEELFVNICRYAYKEGEQGTCVVEYSYSSNPNTLVVSVVDEGDPFDPLSMTDAVSPMDALEHGGLGIQLVRRCVDELLYKRDADRNIVRFVMHW